MERYGAFGHFYPRGTIRSRICVLCHPTKPSPACQTPQWFRLRGDAHPQQQHFPIYPSIHSPIAFLQMTLIPQICWPYRESDDKECRLGRQLLLNKGNSLCVIAPPCTTCTVTIRGDTGTLLRARGGHKERWLAMSAGPVEKKRDIAAGTSGRQWVHPRWGLAIRSGMAGTAENKSALGRSRG